MACTSYLVFFFIHLSLLSLAKDENSFIQNCELFSCGKLGFIHFPFSNRTHPECGLLTVDDCNETVQKIQLGEDGPWYNITDITQDDSIELEDQVFQNHLENRRCEIFNNFTIPKYPFVFLQILSYLTLFKCPKILDTKPTNFSISCNEYVVYYIPPHLKTGEKDRPSLPLGCSLIQLPMNRSRNSSDLFTMLTGVFTLQVKVPIACSQCHWRGGRCQSDSKGKFYCSNTEGRKSRLKLALGLGASGSGIFILIILAYCFRKKLSSCKSMIFWKKTTVDYQNIEDFLRNYGSLAPKRYSYSDIKKITNCFKHKLGQGGHGGVYRGKLIDGRHAAVKVLNESKGNGEEFINEVTSISRTSHVNIVSLLGFCFEGRRRALIYEFVPNGSLEKFIYDKDALNTNHKLNWETLYQIALGIARGLDYLYRGCSTRILHFDIKPHNILLDEDFCPKISDFGLAKICPKKESIVSMTGPRGTVGYIAPEVFCRNFGDVSHKSDVYSYGMMVFEMTGRKNIDVGVNGRSDVYFPYWVYKHLETDEELVLQGIENEEDKEYAMKMIIVSLWCIQTIPSSRPTISKVVEILEGSLESLQIPSKPFLSFPWTSQAGSSTLQTMSIL